LIDLEALALAAGASPRDTLQSLLLIGKRLKDDS